MATYELNSFLSNPLPSDTRLKIYDKNKNLRYTIDPIISFFHKTAHIVIIEIEKSNNIMLDFSTSSEATLALAKLNDAMQLLLKPVPLGYSIMSPYNLNMPAKVTVNDGDLACDSGIMFSPLTNSYVSVFVNGLQVSVGGKVAPYDCYLSVDGISVRVRGDERTGDKLYWNGSVAKYNLDTTDKIDFVYLTQFNG